MLNTIKVFPGRRKFRSFYFIRRTPAEIIFPCKTKIILNLLKPNARNNLKTERSKNSVDAKETIIENRKEKESKAHSNLPKRFKIWWKYDDDQNDFKNFVKWIPSKLIKCVSKFGYIINATSGCSLVFQWKCVKTKLISMSII